MRVTFWGAARGVTGSMHLVEGAGRKILLDCGLFQGKKDLAFERNRQLPFDANSLDAVILSHSHIDHIGNLPSLFRAGYRGPIFGTAATLELAVVMLLDSAKIQRADAAGDRALRRGARRSQLLYSMADVERTATLFRPIELETPFEAAEGISAFCHNAGHMIGSASISLDVRERVSRRLCFSGDVGRRGRPLLRDPRIPEGTHDLIVEGTYGDRNHASVGETQEELARIVKETLALGGRVLIPAFAVGRTQELLYALDQLTEQGKLPIVRSFVDSPLANRATAVFLAHPECYDVEALTAIQKERDHDPLSFPGLRVVRDARESTRLIDSDEPAVIIAASGMCESGRIVHHLKSRLGDPRSTLLFVGFQAEGTLGRRLLDGARTVFINGAECDVKLRIARLDGYSAHAGRDELLQWIDSVGRKGSLERLFLVHGEDKALNSLAGALREKGYGSVYCPSRGDSFSTED